MTRIGHQNLTAVNLTGSIQYPDRNLEYLVFYNNNPAPLYVRLGSPELPNQRNYDISVPPNYIMAISVNSNQFGFRLGDDTVTSSLLTGNTVVEGMIDEAPPALGGVPIQAASLATSDLLNGITTFSGVTTLGPFNLTLWGGALVYVNLGAGSGQAVLQINASNSPSGPWLSVGTYALWPNVPSIINVPRTVAYMQVIINATAIVGEPAISGHVSIRAILSEVQNLAYNPGTQAITKTYALPGLSSQQFTFVTVGLPAVSIAAIATVGSTPGAAITFLVEASSDLVNWRQVTARDQNMSQGITLYRALGNLDLFIRVTISQIVGGQTANGSVYLSIPPQADLGYILNTIQQSLGDKNAPTNTNQDIYHELESIRTLESAIQVNTNNAAVALGSGNLTNILNGMQGSIGGGVLTTILNTIRTDTGNLASINASDAAISTNIGTILNNKMNGSTSVAASVQVAAPGVFTYTGVNMAVNGRIVSARADLFTATFTAGVLVEAFLAYGSPTGAGPAGSFYQCGCMPAGGVGAATQNTGPWVGQMHTYDSFRDSGVNYAGNTGLYVKFLGFTGNAEVHYTVVYVA